MRAGLVLCAAQLQCMIDLCGGPLLSQHQLAKQYRSPVRSSIQVSSTITSIRAASDRRPQIKENAFKK